MLSQNDNFNIMENDFKILLIRLLLRYRSNGALYKLN